MGVLGLLIVAAVALAATSAEQGRSDPPRAHDVALTTPSGLVRADARARDVLRRWDAHRQRAWADGDPTALIRLYLPGSTAGERDVAMLRAWLAADVAPPRWQTQMLDLRVRKRFHDRLVLRVTDRVVATSDGVALASDAVSTRRLDLRLVDGRWRLASSFEVRRSTRSPAGR